LQVDDTDTNESFMAKHLILLQPYEHIYSEIRTNWVVDYALLFYQLFYLKINKVLDDRVIIA